jgi:hypothetical protein
MQSSLFTSKDTPLALFERQPSCWWSAFTNHTLSNNSLRTNFQSSGNWKRIQSTMILHLRCKQLMMWWFWHYGVISFYKGDGRIMQQSTMATDIAAPTPWQQDVFEPLYQVCTNCLTGWLQQGFRMRKAIISTMAPLKRMLQSISRIMSFPSLGWLEESTIKL